MSLHWNWNKIHLPLYNSAQHEWITKRKFKIINNSYCGDKQLHRQEASKCWLKTKTQPNTSAHIHTYMYVAGHFTNCQSSLTLSNNNTAIIQQCLWHSCSKWHIVLQQREQQKQRWLASPWWLGCMWLRRRWHVADTIAMWAHNRAASHGVNNKFWFVELHFFVFSLFYV